MNTKWKLGGTYLESCNCQVACPCVFLSRPTEAECTVLIGWHIDNGSFGDVDLGGLNVALAVHSPGHMMEVKWEAAMYLDNRANETQKDTLTKIFSGQEGGHPARLAAHVGKILGVKDVEISYHAQGKRRSLRIADVAEAEIEAIEGHGGAEVTISNHPLCVAPGYPAVAAKSKRLSYKDHGLEWELSEKNGFFSPFSYEAA